MLSTTVTTCVAVAVFPEPSVAVHVTVVLPSGKLAGALFDAVTLQLSAIVGVPKVTFVNAVAQVPASTFTVTAAGAVIVGSILSSTVTVAAPEAEFPLLSVTVSITVFAPKSSQSKEVISRDIEEIAQLSVLPSLIIAAVMVALPEASSCTVISWVVTVGAMLSKTEIVAEDET
jgi:hypothetical protein